MKKSRYSEEQIVRILREADRDSIAEVAKRHGVSEASIYAWRKRYGEMVSSDVKRLKVLETENSRLKKLVAERDLEIEVMKEIAAKNGERTGSPGTNPFCNDAGVEPATGVCADASGSIVPEV
jgi:putative transposase